MNERYLYRGKRKDNGEWIYGGHMYVESLDRHIIVEHDGCKQFSDECFGFSAVIPETVGQCTGLKDKNGNWIFEGDIIEVSTNHHYVGVAVERQGTFEVVFRGGCFMKKKINGTGMFHFIETDATRIIGNIYDNSELLKGGD